MEIYNEIHSDYFLEQDAQEEENKLIIKQIEKCLQKNLQYQKQLDETKAALESLLSDRRNALEEIMKLKQTLKCPEEPPQPQQPLELCSAYQILSVFHDPRRRRQFQESLRYLKSYEFNDYLSLRATQEPSYIREIRLLKQKNSNSNDSGQMAKRFRMKSVKKRMKFEQVDSIIESSQCLNENLLEVSSKQSFQQPQMSKERIIRKVVSKLPLDGRTIEWHRIGFIASEILVLNTTPKEYMEAKSIESIEIFQMWRKTHIQKKEFTKEEDDQLKELVRYYSDNRWQVISKYMKERHATELRDRWIKTLAPEKLKCRWSVREDLKLVVLVDCCGEGCWFKLATYFKSRSEVQLRERWCNVLQPSLERRVWTSEEDQRLKQLYKQHRNSWSLISLRMEGRTDNECRRRVQKLIQEQVSSAKEVTPAEVIKGSDNSYLAQQENQ